MCVCVFFLQAEDGIRDLVRSRGLGDVYKRQLLTKPIGTGILATAHKRGIISAVDLDAAIQVMVQLNTEGCLLYTSDAADERSSVDLGGRRIIKKKKKKNINKISVRRFIIIKRK